MPKKAEFFDATSGMPVEGYLSFLVNGGNISEDWVKRSRLSRKSREKNLAKLLKQGDLKAYLFLKDWQTAYMKECFYRGIKILLDLERSGMSRL